MLCATTGRFLAGRALESRPAAGHVHRSSTRTHYRRRAVGMARDLHGCQLGPGGLLIVKAKTRRRGHRVAVMAKPVLVVVADEDIGLQALTGELESRYGAHYQVVSSSSAEMALARLAELKAAGADVPLVLADQQMPGMSGTQLLARVRQ